MCIRSEWNESIVPFYFVDCINHPDPVSGYRPRVIAIHLDYHLSQSRVDALFLSVSEIMNENEGASTPHYLTPQTNMERKVKFVFICSRINLNSEIKSSKFSLLKKPLRMHAALHTVRCGPYRWFCQWHVTNSRRERIWERKLSTLIDSIARTLHSLTRRENKWTHRYVSFIPLIIHRLCCNELFQPQRPRSVSILIPI